LGVHEVTKSRFVQLSEAICSIPNLEIVHSNIEAIEKFRGICEQALDKCVETNSTMILANKLFQEIDFSRLELELKKITSVANKTFTKIEQSSSAIADNATETNIIIIKDCSEKRSNMMLEVWREKLEAQRLKYTQNSPIIMVLAEGVSIELERVANKLNQFIETPPTSDNDVDVISTLFVEGDKLLQSIVDVDEHVESFLKSAVTGNASLKDVLENSEIKNFLVDNPELLSRLQVKLL
jgi:hypothetical protein